MMQLKVERTRSRIGDKVLKLRQSDYMVSCLIEKGYAKHVIVYFIHMDIEWFIFTLCQEFMQQ